ncbi:PaaI family thioesterase [Pseudonocardia xishanensis]|uniref:PaaI family thioesterase n=1 Tax=Pseudonocardia xishanensis TaxID=630995 RepID=A0ABP8RFM0_9PSEU
MADEVPAGFEPMEMAPFMTFVGPLYRGPGIGRFGMRVLPEHANTHGKAHGGFLATVVDVAVSRGTRMSLADGSTVSTISMTLDYLEPADIGAWLEIAATVDRVGGRTVFTSARVTVGDLWVAKASAILARHRPRS